MTEPLRTNSPKPANVAEQKPTTSKKKKVRKKKPSSKKSSAANTAAINSAARLQYQKLLQQRNDSLHDAAWLSSAPSPADGPGAIANSNMSSNIPMNGNANGNATNNDNPSAYANTDNIQSPPFLEQDVEIVNRALIGNGLTMADVTVEAFATLLEQARRYAMLLITDAADYAVHSHGNRNITSADLLLAKDMQGDDCLGQCYAENMEQLARITKETNRRVLPPIPDHCYNGIVLPDTEYTLLGRAFSVVCRRDEEDIAEEQKMNGASGLGADAQVMSLVGGGRRDEKGIPSYGARMGSKQVQISLKSQPGKGDSVDIAFNTGHSNDGNPSAHLADSALPDASMDLA
jgi:hypothetical protein